MIRTTCSISDEKGNSIEIIQSEDERFRITIHGDVDFERNSMMPEGATLYILQHEFIDFLEDVLTKLKA